MIEQLGKFLAQVLFERKAGNHQQALSILESTGSTILGFDFNLLDSLSEKEIKDLFGIAMDSTTAGMKCVVAARLLKEKAELRELIDGNRDQAISNYRKALNLYISGISNMKNSPLNLSDFNSDISVVETKIKNNLSG
jgi:hypothetical protein